MMARSDERSSEAFRCDSHDRERRSAQTDGRSEKPGVAARSTLPKPVAYHGDGSPASQHAFLRQEGAAEGRADLQEVEIIHCRELSRDWLGPHPHALVEPHTRSHERREIGQDVVPLTVVSVIGK